MAMTFADLETTQSAGATGTKSGSISGTAAHQAGWLVGISPTAPAGSGINSGAFLDFF
jgi:hypothetical protein